MPQDVSSSRITSDIPEDSIALQPWSMETSADRLMDDLFDEIDHVLEGGAALPTEIVQPEYVSLQPLQISSLSIPATLLPLQQIQQKIQQIQMPAVPTAAEIAPVPPPMTDVATTLQVEEKPRRQSHTVDRLLLLAGGAAIAIPLILWFASQGSIEQFSRLRQAVAPTPATTPVSPQVQVDSNAQFANYMQRSLELLDRQTAAKEQLASNPQATTTAENAPADNSIDRQAQASNRVPTVLERVYIPVYQPPPASPPRPAPQPPPAVAVAPAPAPIPIPAPAPPPRVAVAPSPVMPPPPAETQALVGILELGDRSVALFEAGGVTRRISMGEPIGGSGWTLVEIKNQEAIVRRNGEVRSIYVGQKF